MNRSELREMLDVVFIKEGYSCTGEFNYSDSDFIEFVYSAMGKPELSIRVRREADNTKD